jgi:hypothetical protein
MEYQNPHEAAMPVPPPAASPGGRRRGRIRRIAATSAAAVLLLGGGAAIGVAMTGGASAATAGSGSTRHHAATGRCHTLAARARRRGHPATALRIDARCRNPLLRIAAAGGIHGSITYKARNGTRTVAFERGTVTSVAGSALTVRAADGTTWSWDIVASTIIRESGHKVAQSRLADGETVLVAGPVAGGTNDARLIRIRAVG